MNFVVPNGWEVTSLVCKILVYLGTVSIAGGAFCLWISHEKSRRYVRATLIYVLAGSVLALNAVILMFLVQVGGIKDDGIVGMLDWTMISFIYGTDSGDVAVLRVLGFAMAIMTCILALRHVARLSASPGGRFYKFFWLACSASLLLIVIGFRVVGHVSVLPLTGQVAVALHVIAISLWVGSLFPLLSMCQTNQYAELQLTLKRFGDLAIYMVSVLVLSGGLMVWQLLAAPGELISTTYGVAVVIKVLLVGALLLVAALNKLKLVPCLVEQQDTSQLRKSIRLEIVLATLILFFTSYLSTLIGPEHRV